MNSHILLITDRFNTFLWTTEHDLARIYNVSKISSSMLRYQFPSSFENYESNYTCLRIVISYLWVTLPAQIFFNVRVEIFCVLFLFCTTKRPIRFKENIQIYMRLRYLKWRCCTVLLALRLIITFIWTEVLYKVNLIVKAWNSTLNNFC